MALESYREQFPQLDDGVYVHPSAQVMGDVVIGVGSSVWPNAVIRGDVNSIRIGCGSSIQDGSICHVSHKSAKKPAGSPLVIGDYVTVGHMVILHGCRIGNECLIGMGSIIMDDVVIPDRVMIGAGSLVPAGKVLESNTLYMGRPAQAVRKLTPEEIAFLRYQAEVYVRLKEDYRAPSATPQS